MINLIIFRLLYDFFFCEFRGDFFVKCGLIVFYDIIIII